MADYRAYIVGHDGHFSDCEARSCDEDRDAIEWARQLIRLRDRALVRRAFRCQAGAQAGSRRASSMNSAASIACTKPSILRGGFQPSPPLSYFFARSSASYSRSAWSQNSKSLPDGRPLSSQSVLAVVEYDFRLVLTRARLLSLAVSSSIRWTVSWSPIQRVNRSTFQPSPRRERSILCGP
jgi:hypothetical protein